MQRFSLLRAAVAATIGLSASFAAATAHAADYPDRPIRLILGYTPGGAADAVARSLTPRMSELLGQSVVIEYKSGAGGAIAVESLMRSPPDGYTLHLIDSGTMVVLPNVRKVPFDPLTSFTPVSMAASGGLVLAVHPSLPVKTLPELVSLLKKKPESESYATSGVGGGGHVAAELLRMESGMSMQHISYRGGGPAMADLMGGQINIGMSTLAPAIPQIRGDRIRALAVTSLKRAAALPDVPTIAEQGYPGFEALNWYALVGPKGMPPEITAKLTDVLNQALASDQVLKALREQGLDPSETGVAPLLKQTQSDLDKWKKVVEAANIKAE